MSFMVLAWVLGTSAAHMLTRSNCVLLSWLFTPDGAADEFPGIAPFLGLSLGESLHGRLTS